MPGPALSAGQLPSDAAAPPQAQEAGAVDAREPERGAAEAPRPGIRGWIRERLRRPPDTAPVPRSGFSLAAGTVVSRSGLAGGARYRRVNLFPGGIDAQVGGMVSVRAYQEYAAAVGWLDRDRSTVALDTADTAVASLFNASSPKMQGTATYLDVRHRIYRSHRYYGSGMGSLEGAEADYTLSGTSIDGVWQRQFSPTLGVSLRGGWMNLRVGPGHNAALVDVEDRFDPTARPGWDRSPRFVTVGGGLVWDGRDNPRAPEQGGFIGTSLRRFAAVSESDLSFTRASLDMRAYQRLLGGVVAVRGLASGDLAADGAATPFYLLQSLGGPQTLRGFHPFRFADRALLHASAEFRVRVHRWIEVAPLVDAGAVAPSWWRLSASSILLTPGVGLRARTDRGVLGRLDWSRGREGHRLTFGVGPAF